MRLPCKVLQIINGGRAFLPGDALRRGTANYGSGQRMERLGQKLLAGQPVTITFLGGSITWGRVSVQGDSRWHRSFMHHAAARLECLAGSAVGSA